MMVQRLNGGWVVWSHLEIQSSVFRAMRVPTFGGTRIIADAVNL